ncbi:MAG: hypothetical protein IT410_01715 [Candidatus Doudnabacteria bacterium]|nr:hypothetical protein [Candidatus Doudnabacteria bacterium]
MDDREKIEMLGKLNEFTRQTAHILARGVPSTETIKEQVKKVHEMIYDLIDLGADNDLIKIINRQIEKCWLSMPGDDLVPSLTEINRALVTFYETQSKELAEVFTGPAEVMTHEK